MKKSLIHFSCATAFCLFSLQAALGCAVIRITPLTAFDPSEYIFIGEVVGLADPITSEKFHGEAWGLNIRVKDSVHFPKSPTSHFVVVPFDLESDCKDKGRTVDELLGYFPIGSTVRVIAKESKYVPSVMADGNIRLEVRPDNLGSIARNFSNDAGSMTSGTGVYDYKSYVAGNPCELSETDKPEYEANMNLPDFEFRKDLLRLKNAKSQSEKLKILERLVYFPSATNDEFEVAAKYLNQGTLPKRLMKAREAWRRIFDSKVVLSC